MRLQQSNKNSSCGKELENFKENAAALLWLVPRALMKRHSMLSNCERVPGRWFRVLAPLSAVYLAPSATPLFVTPLLVSPYWDPWTKFTWFCTSPTCMHTVSMFSLSIFVIFFLFSLVFTFQFYSNCSVFAPRRSPMDSNDTDNFWFWCISALNGTWSEGASQA